ncbi:hypothetical protein GEMRC1_013296 [Eukaryota sp. GEM-RC1]
MGKPTRKMFYNQSITEKHRLTFLILYSWCMMCLSLSDTLSSLFNYSSLSDQTLTFGVEVLHVNKSILAISSEYFRSLWYDECSEQAECHTDLSHLKVHETILVSFIKALYGFLIEVTETNAYDLWYLAHYFLVEKLVTQIEQILFQKFTSWSCLECFLLQADENDDVQALEFAGSFVETTNNFDLKTEVDLDTNSIKLLTKFCDNSQLHSWLIRALVTSIKNQKFEISQFSEFLTLFDLNILSFKQWQQLLFSPLNDVKELEQLLIEFTFRLKVVHYDYLLLENEQLKTKNRDLSEQILKVENEYSREVKSLKITVYELQEAKPEEKSVFSFAVPNGQQTSLFSTNTTSASSFLTSPLTGNTQQSQSSIFSNQQFASPFGSTSQVTLGHDVLGQAKSVMGNTALFVLVILQHVIAANSDTDIVAVVITHTREMAQQIQSQFQRVGNLANITVAAVHEGTCYEVSKQTIDQMKPQILVGTSERLAEFVKKGLRLDKVKHFVVDEADKVIEHSDMRADLQTIFKATPKNKQTMMFSAALCQENLETCKLLMENRIIIPVNEDKKLKLHLNGLLHYFINVDSRKKSEKLMNLLGVLKFNQVVIFVNGSSRARALSRVMRNHSFPALIVHGDMIQEMRFLVYHDFKNARARILIATDLAGRGFVVEKVNVVINYDMPSDSDSYLHRVGRAGRFASKGLAILFSSTEDDKSVLNDVQSTLAIKMNELTDIYPEASSYS